MFKCKRCKDTGVGSTYKGTGIAKYLRLEGICGTCNETGVCIRKVSLLRSSVSNLHIEFLQEFKKLKNGYGYDQFYT